MCGLKDLEQLWLFGLFLVFFFVKKTSPTAKEILTQRQFHLRCGRGESENVSFRLERKGAARFREVGGCGNGDWSNNIYTVDVYIYIYIDNMYIYIYIDITCRLRHRNRNPYNSGVLLSPFFLGGGGVASCEPLFLACFQLRGSNLGPTKKDTKKVRSLGRNGSLQKMPLKVSVGGSNFPAPKKADIGLEGMKQFSIGQLVAGEPRPEGMIAQTSFFEAI